MNGLGLDELKKAEAIAIIVAKQLQGRLVKPLLVTDKEAGQLLGVCADTIRTMAERHDLDRITVGDGSRRITVKSVEAYIDRQVEAIKPTP